MEKTIENMDRNRLGILIRCLVILLITGVTNSAAVFVSPLAAHFNWTADAIANVSTTMLLCWTPGALIGGTLMSKIGARNAMLLGAVLFPLGTLTSSFVPQSSPWLLYVTFSFLQGLGNGLAYTVATYVSTGWYPDKRGLVSGLCMAFTGGSSAFLAPICSKLVQSTGIISTLRIVGLVSLVVCVVCALGVRQAPVGYTPAGFAGSASSAETQLESYNVRRALKTRPIWHLIVCTAFFPTMYMIMFPRFSVYMTDAGFTLSAATLGVSIYFIANTLSRLFLGALCDKISYSALMPVPALSFATRYYNCNAGIMVTASHNPAKYNGYKAYGPDGCQMTDEAADIVYAEIQKTDILTGAKLISFEDGMAQGLIEYVGDDCINALYAAIEARSIRPGICKTAGLKLVYSPLNGSGLVPVTHVLGDIGITDITIVPEQKDPDGNFPTCPYPNPEIFEALRLGLELAEKSGADLMLATDPDADRVGIAVKCKDGSYELLSGNEVGVLLLDYICAGRIEQGTMPKNPVMCKSIVSTPLADKVAEHYGVECRNVLTGFKWIGDQIAKLEADGEVDRFIFGFEESYGYLAGPYVRDKDAIIGSMLICEMAAYYRAKGSSIKEELERIYTEYGRYLNKVDSFEFPGLSGMDKMADIMQNLRVNPPKDFAGDKVVKVVDYKKPEETGLPAANVLIYTLESGATVVVRPSGTEPKIKTYFTTKGKDLAEAEAQKEKLAEACKPLLA